IGYGDHPVNLINSDGSCPVGRSTSSSYRSDAHHPAAEPLMNRVACLVAAAFGVVLLPMTGSAQLPREGTEVDSESASGARTSVDGEGVEPAERRRRAPDILEDFSTYASTEEMLSDPRGIYRVQEDFYTGGPNAGGDAGSIVLDTSGGYAGRTQAMCYRWSAQRAPQAGGSISRWMALPDVKEVWIEWSVRFSRNFTVANGF